MKNYSIFILLICVTLFSTSCYKNKEQETRKEILKITSTTFDFIGEEHNKGLDFVYSQTFANKINSNYNDVLIAATKYVFDESPMSKFSKDNRMVLFTPEKRELIKAAVESKSIIINRFELQKKLTQNQFSIIEKLDMALSLPNYEEQLQKIKVLKNEALVSLNDNEIVYILCTLSLAEHSVNYWNSEKGIIWKNRIDQLIKSDNAYLIKTNKVNEFQTTPVNKIDYHNVAVADVSAFMAGFPAGINTGALVGGLTAGIASAGITAGLGAVLGGLAGGTVSGLGTAITVSSIALAAEISVNFFS